MEKGFGIIADDLTGAMDSGAQFGKVGLRTVLHLGPASVDDAEVVALDTESREDPPKLAYEKVGDAARQLKGRVIYKKIDSTLRGNIGYELDGLMDELGLKKALIAPAFPPIGRTTFQGQQLVDGLPLVESAFSEDPLCPTTDHIPTLLGEQSVRSVGHIPLGIVDQGAGPLKEEIGRREEELLVADALSEVHLVSIARVAAHLGISCLTCGSAGLAQALPIGFSFRYQRRQTWRYHPRAGPVLVLAGSRHPATVRQIETVVTRLGVALIKLDARRIEMAIEEAIAELDEFLRVGRDVIITTASESYLPEKRQVVATGLGNLAADIAKREVLSGMVLAGGSTAFSTCCALGVVTIEIQEEVAPGIAAGVVLEGEHKGIRLVTKAGGFGDDDALLKAIGYLRGEHA